MGVTWWVVAFLRSVSPRMVNGEDIIIIVSTSIYAHLSYDVGLDRL